MTTPNHHPRPRSRPGHQPTGGSRMSTESERIAELRREAEAAATRWEHCPVDGCPGDPRYVPPGRRHTCTTDQWRAALSDPIRTVHPAGAADTHTTGAGA